MTHRLLVNPGTPQAWEIALKAGVNRLGRAEGNDFLIPHPSVSGSHCEIIVEAGSVTLRDLGSTNGSFVNKSPVRETRLESGQHLQLGAVDMILETTAGTAAAVSPLAVPIGSAQLSAPPPPPPVRLNLGNSANPAQVRVVLPGAAPTSAPPPPPPPVVGGGLSLSGLHKPAAAPVAAETTVAAVEEEPPIAPPVSVPLAATGAEFCKFHAKIPARFYCGKCQKFYCDMCVATRSSGSGNLRTCRACGAQVTAIQVHTAQPAGGRSFFRALPGAFIYPFRGVGVMILIFAAMAFSALAFISAGLLGLFIRIAFYGFLFLFMQNIIHTTTSDENESLGFPEAGGLFGAAFQLGATIVSSFGLAIGFSVAKFFEVDIPVAAIIAAWILGCIYFPMAFLAVAMKDSVMAANPLIVVPTILRMPLEYLVTTVLLIGVFGIRQLGNYLSAAAGTVSLSTKDMSMLFAALGVKAGIAFFNVYLLTVTMRVLGLLYNTKKDSFGWFGR